LDPERQMGWEWREAGVGPERNARPLVIQ
jgi:hypothetical protein